MNYRTSTFGDVCAIRVVKEDEDVIIISSEGIMIRTPVRDISMFARPSKGVRVMRVGNGDKVATLTVVKHIDEEEQEQDEAEQSSPEQETQQVESEQTLPEQE